MSSVERTNGWTGGQYSLYRVVLGGYLLVYFLSLGPWHLAGFEDALLPVAVIAGVAFVLGWFDRVAALALLYSWACHFGRNPFTLDPNPPFLGWLLLAHVLLPGRPYGSWGARGRTDPDGGWLLPQPIHRIAWIALALGYLYRGLGQLSQLSSPDWVGGSLGLTWGVLSFEILFAPLTLNRRLRPWIWFGMLIVQLTVMGLVDCAELRIGIVALHLFAFDPHWVKPLNIEERVTLFYDGTCGLCHRCVRFVLAEDHAGAFRALAPLHHESLRRALAETESLPDSIVLRRADGTLLVRSAAVLCILRRLGGCWRVIATVLGLVPRVVLDVGYRGLAGVRRWFFRQPEGPCPVVAESLRGRFLSD